MIWIGLAIGVVLASLIIFLVLGLCKASARADLEQEILFLKHRIYGLLLERITLINTLKGLE